MLNRCPGSYCGRIINANGSFSEECTACPRGFRVHENFACVLCVKELNPYSWMYLGFMAMLPLMLHWYCIDLTAKKRKFAKDQLICHGSAFVEVAISGILSIIVMEPVWTFSIHTCGVNAFSDWYTLFFNPVPKYDIRLHCTQEAVYPLQTVVLVFYFNCLVAMLIIRSVLNLLFGISRKSNIYSALYFLPILAFTHAVGCGLIYYAFPYISILISMVTNALHYSLKLDQSVKSLINSSILDTKNVFILGGHCIFLAYGLISLHRHYGFLVMVPLPSIFYIATVRFTDPSEFRDREGIN